MSKEKLELEKNLSETRQILKNSNKNEIDLNEKNNQLVEREQEFEAKILNQSKQIDDILAENTLLKEQLSASLK